MVAGIGVNFLTETDTSIALNQLNFSNFEDQLNWNSNRYLYGKLDQNSGLATTNTLMDSFYDSIENLSPARYQDIELSLKEANTLQPVTISFIENLRELMAVLHDSIAKIDSLMRIDPPAANPLVLENLRMSLMSQMAVLNGQLKAAIDGFYSVYLQNINDLSTENLTLVDTSVFESNEQLINDIYFNTFARGENNLTDVQKNIIVSVASQCPLSGGKAVYLARCLLVKFSDTLFNDYESCLMEGIIKNGTINLLNQLNFTCSPNPADTHLQISCDQAIDEQAILSIYNNTGMKVTQDGIDLKQKTHTFDTCKLLPGVYFLQIVCHNSVQNLGKIIISH